MGHIQLGAVQILEGTRFAQMCWTGSARLNVAHSVHSQKRTFVQRRKFDDTGQLNRSVPVFVGQHESDVIAVVDVVAPLLVNNVTSGLECSGINLEC